MRRTLQQCCLDQKEKKERGKKGEKEGNEDAVLLHTQHTRRTMASAMASGSSMFICDMSITFCACKCVCRRLCTIHVSVGTNENAPPGGPYGRALCGLHNAMRAGTAARTLVVLTSTSNKALLKVENAILFDNLVLVRKQLQNRGAVMAQC